MSPSVIVNTALNRGLAAIAITDHNTTLQCKEIQRLGWEHGLTVFSGVEVTSREEVHAIILFPDEETRLIFQQYIEDHLPPINNSPERFGDQVYVNRYDEIQGEIPYLLITAIDQTIDQIASFSRQLNCLFIPAHIERPSYSLISQLGFLDPSFIVNAIEYNNKVLYERLLTLHPYLKKYTCYSASDAHYPDQIGLNPSVLRAPTLSYDSLRKAFLKENGYSIDPENGIIL